MTKARDISRYGLGVGIQSASSVIAGVGITQLNFIGTGNTFRASGGTIDIDIDVENDRAALAIAGGKLSHLVGSRGEVLDSLQELTRLAVQTSLGERSRLMLDIDNFRSDKKAELAQLAKETAEEVKSTGEAIKLPPMNAFERKVVHDTIQEIGLTSESEGEDPDRCVVVLPA